LINTDVANLGTEATKQIPVNGIENVQVLFGD
jgi:hypothetical protein